MPETETIPRPFKLSPFPVLTRLDYGNSVLAGLPIYTWSDDSGQCSAERGCAVDLSVIACGDPTTSPTRWPASIGCASMRESIKFKIAVLTYKVVHGLAPEYFVAHERR